MDALRRSFCYFALILVLVLVLFLVLVGCASKVIPQVGASPTITEGLDEPTSTSAHSVPTSTATTRPSATPEPMPTSIPKRYTAILLGKDRTGTGTGPRTDVFIILTYIPHWNDLLIISVPRDLYVEYGGQARIFCDPPSERDRINRAYALGGADCVRSVVEHTFGLDVNTGVAVVGFNDFIELVNGMNGLMIHPDWLPDPIQVDGEELLRYVRERMASGAINRDRRGIEVLIAMKEQWLDAYPFETILAVTSFAFERVKVDMSFGEFVELIKFAKDSSSEDLNVRKVVFLYEQEVTFHTTENGASVLLPLVDLSGWMDCLLSGHGSEACAWSNPLEGDA